MAFFLLKRLLVRQEHVRGTPMTGGPHDALQRGPTAGRKRTGATDMGESR